MQHTYRVSQQVLGENFKVKKTSIWRFFFYILAKQVSLQFGELFFVILKNSKNSGKLRKSKKSPFNLTIFFRFEIFLKLVGTSRIFPHFFLIFNFHYFLWFLVSTHHSSRDWSGRSRWPTKVNCTQFSLCEFLFTIFLILGLVDHFYGELRDLPYRFKPVY